MKKIDMILEYMRHGLAAVSAVAIGVIMWLATIFGELIALVAWLTICAIAIAYLALKEGSKEDKKDGNRSF